MVEKQKMPHCEGNEVAVSGISDCDNTIKASSDIEHVDWSTGTSASGQHYANVRFGSGSSQASQSSGDICRICHCESDPQNPLLTPCYCSGSLKYVHQTCLQQWLTASETNACELCKFPFIMHTKIKPFNEWRSLDISSIERRRLCCTLLFHFAAALCVIWSLCVLIERAADDVKRGAIDWPFWTKLAVVTVGMTGGIVFMYIQCKTYLHLCHRWKARNRILLIQNAPEKIHPISPPSPIVQTRNRRSVSGCGGVADNLSSNEPRTSNNHNQNAAAATDTLEIAENFATTASLSGFSYTSASGVMGIGTASDLDSSRAVNSLASAEMGHHLHHNHHLRHHFHQQSDQDDLNIQSTHLLPQQQLGQVAVSANIECSQSQSNYERDWPLDDVVSHISSFRPCILGSGSMTIFHDSIQNTHDHSEGNCSSRDSRQNLSTGGISSDIGRDHALQLSSFSGSVENKAPSIGSGVSNAVANGLGGFVYKPHNKRYSNSSMFLENRDILDDSAALSLNNAIVNDYPKSENYLHYHHHHQQQQQQQPQQLLHQNHHQQLQQLDNEYVTTTSDGVMEPINTSTVDTSTSDMVGADTVVRHMQNNDQPTNDYNLNKYVEKHLRRYSDTKLSDTQECEALHPMLLNTNAANSNIDGEAAISMVTDMPMTSQRARQMLLMTQNSESATNGHDANISLDMRLPTTPLSPPSAFIGFRKTTDRGWQQQEQQQQQQQLASRPALRHSIDIVDDANQYNHAGLNGNIIERGHVHQTTGHPNAHGNAGIQRNSMAFQNPVIGPSVATSAIGNTQQSRHFFQSLPNLSNSCENLIKK